MQSSKRVKLSPPPSPWRLSPVLAPPLTAPLPVIAVYTARVVDRRLTSRLIRQLNVASPIAVLTHLKRCHAGQVILALADVAPEECVRRLADGGVDLEALDLVPAGGRQEGLEQLSDTNQTAFHDKPKAPRELPESSRLNDELPQPTGQVGDITGPPGQSGDISKPSKVREPTSEPPGQSGNSPKPLEIREPTSGPPGLSDDAPEPLEVREAPRVLCKRQFVAAVKPRTRAQYDQAMSLWPTNFHEDKELELTLSGELFSGVQLAEMERVMRLCVEAGRRGGGCSGAAVVDAAGAVLAVVGDERARHPLQHAVMLAVDVVAAGQGGGAWTAATGRKAEAKTGPYLCTGYDVYVVREPCAMCAMALVHSRAKRVFYGCGSRGGALKTLTRLHNLAGLNHNFLVFGGVLEAECRALSESESLREREN